MIIELRWVKVFGEGKMDNELGPSILTHRRRVKITVQYFIKAIYR